MSHRKTILLLLLALFLLGACNSDAQQMPHIDSTEIIVRGKGKHSREFIEGLRQLGPALESSTVEIIDSLLIFDRTTTIDTLKFPRMPRLGKSLIVSGRKGGLHVTIHVRRVNYTSVEYKIEMRRKGHLLHTQSGRAHLNTGYVFATEMGEDEFGEGYPVDEYIWMAGDCYTYIRLGFHGPADAKPRYLVTFHKNCNGAVPDSELNNFPDLTER